MSGESTNIETVRNQSYRFGQLNSLNMDLAANHGGIYKCRDIAISINFDDNGRIAKAVQTNTLGYDIDGKPIVDKVATIFTYNENGDIKQQIYDYHDDGKYEFVYDFDNKYDENNKLISHEETMWSRLKNGCKRFFMLEESEHAPKRSKYASF